ncbi:MAG TPA: acyltransferase [Acidimicrobiales bacterium]|nr:acyltransferase [Acidimicrobiales bacterium]
MGTSSSAGARRDTSLDVLRTLAALGVVATHARWLAHPSAPRTGSLWEDIHTSLWVGSRTSVYLFFALSGFLIARPFITALLGGAPLPEWRDYARRRVARIVPAYWLAFTAFLVFGFATSATFVNVADHYLLLHNEVPGDTGNLLPVAWTLGIEASFYVAVPLVALVARRRWTSAVSETRLLAWLGGLTVASGALHLAVFTRALPTGWRTVEQYTLPAQFLFFAPGVVLAVVEHRRRRPVLQPRTIAVAGACAAAGWVYCMYLFAVPGTRAGISSIGFALLSGLILCLGRWSPEPVSPVGRAMVWVGTVSYGLYLWHWLVMRAFYGWWGAAFAGTGALSWPLSTALVFALSLPLAAASFSFVERPAMRLAAGRRRRAPARDEGTAQPRGTAAEPRGTAAEPGGLSATTRGMAAQLGGTAAQRGPGTAVARPPRRPVPTLPPPTTLSSPRGSVPW